MRPRGVRKIKHATCQPGRAVPWGSRERGATTKISKQSMAVARVIPSCLQLDMSIVRTARYKHMTASITCVAFLWGYGHLI